MDDILEHLGIVLLIVISVAAQITKSAKKAAKNSRNVSTEPEEPVFGNIAGKSVSQPGRPEKRFVSAPTVKPKNAKKQPKTEPKPAPTVYKPNCDKAAKNSPKANPQVLTGDFDLRKAVIYSEVLTPKFKEE